MREIKYRAWDIELQEMRDEFLGKSGDEPGDWILFFKKEENIEGIQNPYPRQRFVLLEYAGLKDRDGREIYEGDIISEDPSIWNEHFYYFIVNMRDGCWEAKSTIPFDKNARGCLLFNIKNPKVEGNIYENPELIKEEW